MKQIKVKDTKMHKTKVFKFITQDSSNTIPEDGRTIEVPVAEAKLVLVECKLPHEWKIDSLVKSADDSLYISNHNVFKANENGQVPIKPILISETEKIEVGDWTYHPRKDMQQLKQLTNPNAENDLLNLGWRKVLALSEHFNPKHLQAIVDGKMKDGDKVLVECEKINLAQNGNKSKNSILTNCHNWVDAIKLNSSSHITLHKVEEKMVPFSMLERVWNAARELKYAPDYDDMNPIKWQSLKEWFEQNVK